MTKPSFGLRTRFFLYSNTLIIVTMSIVTVFAVTHERKVRYEAIEQRGRSIAEALAIPITDAMMHEELGLVAETGLTDNYIDEMMQRNGDLLRYVIVTNEKGIVTHSNHWALLGKPLERALGPGDMGQGTITERLGEPGDEGQLLEVRTPLHISTRFWGSLTMGFSLEPIEALVQSITKQAILVAVVLILGNSALTAFYVESLLRPILALHQTMKRAGSGDLSVRAAEGRGNEIHEIGTTFNRMMDELESAREREQLRANQLAHMEKMAAVGTLAAGVAHEVNNPLGGVLMCIDNIRANPKDQKMQQEYLPLIQDGLRRIERTISNLLDFSRQRQVRLEPTSINHNLRHVSELTAYQLRKGNVEIDWQLDGSEPIVMADHFQMEQLFLNLFLNALQAMPEGGRLVLRTRVKEGFVVAEVKDTGVGMSRETQERIFDPFYTTRDVGEGTGLGLTVSDSIVAAHRGVITVESEPGEGSVFRVSLPLLERQSAEESA